MPDLFLRTKLPHAMLCGLAILVTSPGLAQDVKELRDSAYCVGVLRHSSGMVARLCPAAQAQDQRERLAQKSVLVAHAIGANDLDSATTRSLIALGRADAQLCWDQVDRCFDSNAADLHQCMKPVEEACLRTKMCER